MTDNETLAPRKLPIRYAGAQLGDLQHQHLDPVAAYVENLPQVLKQGLGLCISGGPGTGKTHALAVVHKEVQRIRPGWGMRNALWAHSGALFSIFVPFVIDQLFSEPCTDVYTEARWLVIDGLGEEDPKLAKRVVDLLRKRSEAQRPTSFTTQLDPRGNGEQSLLGRYGPPFVSLISEACAMVHLTGKDWRRP